MLRNGGKDATKGFDSVNHSENAKKQMAKYKVGFARSIEYMNIKERSESSGVMSKLVMFVFGLVLAVLYS